MSTVSRDPFILDRPTGRRLRARDAIICVFVAALLLLGSLPLFLGLAVVLPVLGHATWHLYRKVVEPDRVLAARELAARVCAAFACPYEPHLTLHDELDGAA